LGAGEGEACAVVTAANNAATSIYYIPVSSLFSVP